MPAHLRDRPQQLRLQPGRLHRRPQQVGLTMMLQRLPAFSQLIRLLEASQSDSDSRVFKPAYDSRGQRIEQGTEDKRERAAD
jgi:hypothetical protein